MKARSRTSVGQDPNPLQRQVILELADVNSYIGQSHILRGVDLAVRTGSVTVLLGRNGVGKTSTLRSVLGLMHRTGSILFNGEDLDRLEPHQIVRRGIAYVPENRDVFRGLTVAENLRLAERRESPPNYDRVYELFPDLRDRRQQMAGTLSGGQQQMVSVSRALLNDNLLLLIDEPTKGLAPRLVTELVETLERVAAHTTVLLVEQNLAVAHRMATDIVLLAEGLVVQTGAAAEVLADEASVRRLLGVDSDHASPAGSA